MLITERFIANDKNNHQFFKPLALQLHDSSLCNQEFGESIPPTPYTSLLTVSSMVVASFPNLFSGFRELMVKGLDLPHMHNTVNSSCSFHPWQSGEQVSALKGVPREVKINNFFFLSVSWSHGSTCMGQNCQEQSLGKKEFERCKFSHIRSRTALENSDQLLKSRRSSWAAEIANRS